MMVNIMYQSNYIYYKMLATLFGPQFVPETFWLKI